MKLDLSRNEAVDHEFIDRDRMGDGEEEKAEEGPHARLVGEDGVGTDEDEEIESDEAFEESDDERFAGFTFRGSGKRKVCHGLLVPATSLHLTAHRTGNQPKVNPPFDGDNPSNESDEDMEVDGNPEDFIDIRRQ